MVICRIEFRIDGQAGHAIVHAPTSIDGLLQWLATIPQSAGVKAIVRVINPVEIVQ